MSMKSLTFFLLMMSFFLYNCGDNSEVIESLSGNKITVKSFEKAYDTAIESMSRMQNIEKSNLLEFIEKDPDQVPEQFRGLNQQFKKNEFYKEYRRMLMTKIVADKAGFTERPEIKAILDFVQMQTIATLYLQEEVEKKINITNEEAKEECELLRAKSPELASQPIDRCLMFGRANIKRRRSAEIYDKVMERIKEGVTIQHNEKFDLDSYLTSQKKAKAAADASKDAKEPPKK